MIAGVNSLTPLSTTVTPPTATLDNPSCKTPILDFMKPIRRIQLLKIRHRRTDVSPHAAPLYFKTERPTMSGTVYNYRQTQSAPLLCANYRPNQKPQCSIHWTIPDSSIRHLTAGHKKHSERTVQQPAAPRPLLLSFQPVICRPNQQMTSC